MTEGRNLSMSLYWARGREDMDAVARQLVASDPEVIVGTHGVCGATAPVRRRCRVRLQREPGRWQTRTKLRATGRQAHRYDVSGARSRGQARRVAEGMGAADSAHRHPRQAATP